MHKQSSVYIAIALLSATIIAGCLLLLHTQKPTLPHANKLRVVCTTSMLTDAIRHVGGDHIVCTGLMGPGVDPHIYRARERDAHALTDADIIFYNGLHLEGKMIDIFKGLQHYAPCIAVADELNKQELLCLSQTPLIYDPHIWFDVPLWMHVVHTIRDALIHVDPIHATDYRSNTTAYLEQLQQLNTYIKDKVTTIAPAQRMLITAHDAFGYFGKAYGFTVVGLQGINTDAQASTQDIQAVAELVIKHKIPAIFVESSIPHRTLQAVQDAVHAHGWHITIDPELYSDALGAPGTQEATYIGMMKHNIDAIARGLTQLGKSGS
ncbi:MAG TPA: zinc ABC transporter substrate-binding protein [Candidatus Limnocylindria bacterium]|nr:zinc ABC transporter substrate-binding protein [Candidatus Limnocylindria bacterium]